MPSGLGPFHKKRVNTGDPLKDLWLALEHAEYHLARLPGTTSVQVDESGPVSVSFGDGSGGSGGSGGGGGGNSTPHPLLDGTENSDTAIADPVAGDLIYANASALWDRLPKGTDGQVNTMVAGEPAWADPAASGTGEALLFEAYIPDISALTTSYVAQGRYPGLAAPTEWNAPKDGTITGLSVKLTGGVGTAGNDLKVDVFVGGVSAGLEATIAGGASPGTGATTVATAPYVTADQINVRAKRVGTPDARGAVLLVYGFLG